jgi:hypothetical protein
MRKRKDLLLLLFLRSQILTMKPSRQCAFGLIQRCVPVPISDGDKGPELSHQVVCQVPISPETGVVKGRVPMLVDGVHLCLLMQKESDHVMMSVSSGQMQRRVIPFVHNVDPCPPLEQELHYLVLSVLCGPVEGTESMVISREREN